MPLRPRSKGRDAWRGSAASARGVLGLETGEDPEGPDRLGDAAGERHIHLSELNHLRRLDQGGIAGGTCGPDRVVGAGDAEVHRNLAGGVVEDGSRVVVVGPVVGVVVVPADVVDFVFGLDGAVLGQADIDADAGRIIG